MTRLKLGLITFMCFVCFSAMSLFSACATQGEKGDKGETGNGIFSIAKVSTDGLTDTYKITYTDGNFTTFCVTNGQVGQNGIGIEDVEINSEGELVIVFTDDNSINLGKVIGKDGVGIQSASVDVDGNLSIVLTDEKIINLGNIKGEDGVSITKTEIDENGNLLITFSDRQEPVNLGKVVGADGQDGTVWLVGADVPDNALGKDGDLYLDSITKILYKKNGNVWEEQFSLVDERKSFTLTFDTAGGEMQGTESITVEEGKYVQLPVPTKDDYIFIGWYNGTGANAGQVTNTTPIFADMVLTAHWEADFSEGLRYSLNADGSSYTCTGIGNYFGNKIKFPSLYNGLPITAIAESAFA